MSSVGAASANATAAFDPNALIGAISGGTGDPLSLIMSQLGTQAPDSPIVTVLSRLLEQRRSSPPADADGAKNEEDGEPAAHAERERQERERSMRELRDTVTKVYAELESLRTRNDAIAAGLGACFLCFGTDPLCQECGGRGRPGSRAPEPAAYREYVVPAMERVRIMQAGSQRRPPRSPPPPARASPGHRLAPRGETMSWQSADQAPSTATPATAEGEGGAAP